MNSPNDLTDLTDRIARTLTTLGETAAPAGLERRVRQGVHARTLNLTPRSWIETLEALASTRSFRFASATAAAAIVITLLAHRDHAPDRITAQPHVSTRVSAAQPLRSLSAKPPHHDPPGTEAPATTLDLATLETRAPSLPAPTLPLTADERLMQTVVLHGELPQLAELHRPDPLPAGIAPLFAGFASRSEANVPADDPRQEAPITLGNDNQ